MLVGAQPGEHGQRRGLDAERGAAGAGDRRLGAVDVAVLRLRPGETLHQPTGFGLIAREEERVGRERGQVAVLALLHARLQRGDLLLESRGVGLEQGPEDVGVGDVLRRAAEGVERAAVALEAALAVAAREQPGAGPREHVGIDVHHLRHVVELEHAIGGQGLVSRIAAEPLVAAVLALEGDELAVAALQHGLRAGDDLRVDAGVRLHVLQRHHVGIVRRAGLLEAAAGLAQQRGHGIGHGGQRRGIDRRLADRAAGQHLLGNREGVLGDALEHATEGVLDREAGRHDPHRPHHGVAVRAGTHRDAQGRGTAELTGTNRKQDARRGVRRQRRGCALEVREHQATLGVRLERERQRLVRAVDEHERHLDAVAGRDLERDLGLDVERALHLDGALADAEGAVGAVAVRAQADRGDRIARRELDRRAALGIGLEAGVPVHGLGEVAAHAGRAVRARGVGVLTHPAGVVLVQELAGVADLEHPLARFLRLVGRVHRRTLEEARASAREEGVVGQLLLELLDLAVGDDGLLERRRLGYGRIRPRRLYCRAGRRRRRRRGRVARLAVVRRDRPARAAVLSDALLDLREVEFLRLLLALLLIGREPVAVLAILPAVEEAAARATTGDAHACAHRGPRARPRLRVRQRTAPLLAEGLQECARCEEREPAPALGPEQEIGVGRPLVGAVEVGPGVLELLHLGAEQGLRGEARRTLTRIDGAEHGVVRRGETDDGSDRTSLRILGLDLVADGAAGDGLIGLGGERDGQARRRTTVDEALGLRAARRIEDGDAQHAGGGGGRAQGDDGRLAALELHGLEGELLLADVQADGGSAGLRGADHDAHGPVGGVGGDGGVHADAVVLDRGECHGGLDARGLGEYRAVRATGDGREGRAATTLVHGGEGRDLAALVVDDAAGDVGRFLARGLGLEVHAARHAGDELAALGIEGEIDALQHDRQRLGGRLGDALVGNAQRERAHAVADALRQGEGHARAAEAVEAVVLAVDLLAVQARDGRDERHGRRAALRALGLEGGLDAIAGPVGLHTPSEDAFHFYNLVLNHPIENILELGFQHGVSTCYFASALKEKAKGKITSIDRRDAKDYTPTIFQLSEKLELNNHMEIILARETYVWELKKIIQRQSKNDICEPLYDFCFLDGAHSWKDDGLAFFLIDKLLKPGSWILFDDVDWTYNKSKGLKNSDFVREMDEDEKSEAQVQLVFDLLVKQNPNYHNFYQNGRWAWAQKKGNGISLETIQKIKPKTSLKSKLKGIIGKK